MTIETDVQQSNPGKKVELFDLDVSGLGGGVHYFLRGSRNRQPVVWRGNTYMPIDLKTEGFEMNGEGTLPRPILKAAHISTSFLGLVNAYDDLVGAWVTRWRTFAKYLDGEPLANPNMHFQKDLFRVNRKPVQNKVYIEWELAAAMDQEGKMLPGRQVLRDRCGHRYRVWTGSGFDYSAATCPYTGGSFDAEGNPVMTGAEDVCSKRVSDCEIRHPGEPLPFRGFPGVARTRL